tara:strand:+ start:18484 stop:18693 length:210 start_codon:yes stop_codon:yes gene_type:complete
MKVTIEKAIFDLDKMVQLQKLIKIALDSKSIDEFYKAPKEVHLFTIGKGSAHSWVSNHNGQRILLITEN